MAGLTAAHTLSDAGFGVTVLDKSPAVGGRMATKRSEGASYDHGAQRFRARSPEFRGVIDEWVSARVVRTWFDEERISQGVREPQARLIGVNGMRGIAEFLAEGLDVRTGIHASRVAVDDDSVVVLTDKGPVAAAAAIVTPPVPQTLALVDLDNDPALREELAAVRYNACLAVMAKVGDTRSLPTGHATPDSRTIAWIADNQHKGVSRIPAVTIHSTPGFAGTHLESDPAEWVPMLVASAGEVLDTTIMDPISHRWRYSEPQSTLGTGCAVLGGRAPIVLAGEAFSSPRVEGAYLSGLAAARSVQERLG